VCMERSGYNRFSHRANLISRDFQYSFMSGPDVVGLQARLERRRLLVLTDETFFLIHFAYMYATVHTNI